MILAGKRGFAKSQLAQMILVLAAAIFLIGPVVNVTNFAYASTDVEKCRLNVVLASMKTTYGILFWEIGPDNPFYIDCPKRYAYVSNDNIKVDKINTKLETDDSEEREKQLKEFVLSEMTKCWRSFGDASDKVYQARPGAGEADIGTSETACFSCSDVFFSDNFEETTIHGFYEYANSKRRAIDGKSYAEFLTGGTKIEGFSEDKDITFGPNQQWSTVFTIKRLDNTGWFDHLGAIGSVIGRRIKEHNLPEINSAIANCWMMSVNDDGTLVPVRYDGPAIGCSEGGINGLVFGKVAAGYDKLTFSLKDLVTGGMLINENVARFPMTVRFVPSEDVLGENQCKRLY